MKLRIASDLHLEFEQAPFGPDYGRLASSRADELQADLGIEDLLILAGDTHGKTHGVNWVHRHFSHLDTLMIGGNHEFYGARFPRQTELNKLKAVGTNLRYLENESFSKNGIHFFGGTLWTDYAVAGERAVAMMSAREIMNDYKKIRRDAPRYPRLRPEDLLAAHVVTRKAIIDFLASHDPSKCVVVTHHAPSPHSLTLDYRVNHPISAAYASDLESIISRFQPRLWVHGHTHTSYRYTLGETEVICNPRGYVSASLNPNFDSQVTVEL